MASRGHQSRPPRGPECQKLGVVVGESGGTFRGGCISNDHLTEYEMNDALSKAATGGANTLQITPGLSQMCREDASGAFEGIRGLCP
jgi:hypothetical protein